MEAQGIEIIHHDDLSPRTKSDMFKEGLSRATKSIEFLGEKAERVRGGLEKAATTMDKKSREIKKKGLVQLPKDNINYSTDFMKVRL